MLSDLTNLLYELRLVLEQNLAERLNALILFGSYARQEASVESDIDLLIVLDDVPNYLVEYRKIAPLLQRIAFRYDKVVSIILVSQSFYEQSNLPFYRNIKQEGKKVA